MIYLDNAATTKPDRECLKKAENFLDERFYNPSSVYREGYSVRLDTDRMREGLLAHACSTREFELIFTSCGTEADNQALFCGAKRGNVVTTAGEHSAVFSAANELRNRGADVRFASLNSEGSVNADSLLSLIDEKTSLVSVIHVNNETGAINDINGISRAVKEKNPGCLFHSDGVQAFGKIDMRLGGGVDMYSVSAHKIGGLKGCGALFRRKGVRINPYLYGGGQESGMRSGTENVYGIAMFAYAAEKRFASISENYEKIKKINDLIRKNLDDSLFEIISPENGSPYILTVTAPGVRGETVLHEADDAGLLIGTGSACSSNEKKRYSRVILSCGIDEVRADGILRLSFSPDNTEDDAVRAVQILNGIVKNRKEMMS